MNYGVVGFLLNLLRILLVQECWMPQLCNVPFKFEWETDDIKTSAFVWDESIIKWFVYKSYGHGSKLNFRECLMFSEDIANPYGFPEVPKADP